MERIDLYDKYINNQLSDKERADFDARLESDENFASDFKVYLFTVDGICREVHQDNLDFGLAMKRLSKDQLKEIIGKDRIRKNPWDNNELPGMCTDRHILISAGRTINILSDENERTSDLYSNSKTTPVPETISIDSSEHKPSKNRFWIWQVASIAAVVIIAFAVVLNIEKTARYSIDNAIYACAEINPDLVRAGGEPFDAKSMNDDELKTKLPELIALYQSASNTDEIADNGYALAMAYLRLHDRDNAKVILEQLVSRFDGNADYAESVSRWKSILNLLK